MRVWIMANDREEKMTIVKEYFIACGEVRDFIRKQIDYHRRNGVKAKAKCFMPEIK